MKSQSQWPTGYLQCFDAVGWVIWPVKIVPKMTYKVSSGTLNLCSINQSDENFMIKIASFRGNLADKGRIVTLSSAMGNGFPI